ncbi:Uncharacterised protein [Mycobacterium tuberculosis]|nr:Uncharacterised protein [Mycobacterium tuberculosis]
MRIGQHGEPAHRRNVSRFRNDLAARCGGFGRRGVGVIHRKVDVPMIRHAGHRRFHTAADFRVAGLEHPIVLARSYLHARVGEANHSLVER